MIQINYEINYYSNQLLIYQFNSKFQTYISAGSTLYIDIFNLASTEGIVILLATVMYIQIS